MRFWTMWMVLGLAACGPAGNDGGSGRTVLILAGPKSHLYGDHEFEAGGRLLADLLNGAGVGVRAEVLTSGWFDDEARVEAADAVVVYADGLEKSPINGHEAVLQQMCDAGKGIGFLHYACCVDKETQGGKMMDWIGGYYELWYTVNPIWVGEFKEIPTHPVTRGMRPFTLREEWYFNLRFRPDMTGVVPLLTAIPPDYKRKGPDGEHTGNEFVRARMGMPEHVAWAAENANGSRGFGYTGGHYHWNWAHPMARKCVLNALVWLAGGEVPEGGVETPMPGFNDMQGRIPQSAPADWYDKKWRTAYDEWAAGRDVLK
jgi:hypothetical protein